MRLLTHTPKHTQTHTLHLLFLISLLSLTSTQMRSCFAVCFFFLRGQHHLSSALHPHFHFFSSPFLALPPLNPTSHSFSSTPTNLPSHASFAFIDYPDGNFAQLNHLQCRHRETYKGRVRSVCSEIFINPHMIPQEVNHFCRGDIYFINATKSSLYL